MSKQKSVPALPVPLNPGQPWQGMAPCDGMTLRDYFAAKAMQALITGLVSARPGDWLDAPDWAPGVAWEVADEMLNKRGGQ